MAASIAIGFMEFIFVHKLPVPSHRTPVLDKPVARASSLETLILPSNQIENSFDTKSHEVYLHSGKPIKEKRDIYKEAFESAKLVEENKFKSKFDRLVSELKSALAHLPSSGVSPACTTTSYGDVLVTYRARMKELILIFEQRLRLAYESFDIPHPDESTTQRVKQNVSRLVEDLLGETLDLTSDEAVSDLSSLSDESGQEQNSFEDQIAQVIVSKLLEGHQKDQTHRYTNPKGRLPNNLGNYEIRSEEDEVDSSSDILRDFEELRDFVRQTQTRRSPVPRDVIVEETALSPICEDPVERVHLGDKDEQVDDFHTRCSSFDRVYSSSHTSPPLPDFSQFDNIDFTSHEIDPDLLSMNLASIPEETEEELEDDAVVEGEEEEGGGEKRWGENWVFKGALSPYDNCGKRRIGHDTDKPLYMMVPNPEDNYVPKVGNRDADQLSDLSDTETKSTDDLSDDENTFYAKTSEELARISRKHSSSVQSDSDLEADRSSSSTYKRRVESILQKSSETGRESETVKLVETLIQAENDDPRFVVLPESSTVVEGEPLKLSCTVAGTPPIDVFWYYEDKDVIQLEDSEDFDVQNEADRHSITLFNLTTTQSGQYMCIALSELGKCTKYFTVTVTSKSALDYYNIYAIDREFGIWIFNRASRLW
ncbi:myopalladin-like [Gigantopelta aegis]|uniref:myopalladin-like n=1 Tax=Gigantopelta aegis TaxID=1735272 RepID=UPI001B88AED1|nr:myopalladin-like [Gigantopelta aegis]